MRRNLSKLALLLTAVAVACSDGSPTSPPDGTPTDSTPPIGGAPRSLPVVAAGAVSVRFTAEVAERDGWAYTTTWGARGGNPGNTVYIWNVSGVAPVLTDSLTIPFASTTGDVQISPDGGLLVVATERLGGSIVIYDRTNPAKPVQLARYTSPNTDPGVHTVKLGLVGGRLHGFLSIDPIADIDAKLVVVDLADPSRPRELLARTMGDPFVHDVFVRDGILFTANWNDGLVIWDIGGAGKGGTPADPVQLGSVRTASYNGQPSVHNVWWFNDPRTGSKRYAFVGEENSPAVIGASATGDIHVVDVSDFARPKEVAFFHIDDAGTHNFHMDEQSGILYAAYYNGGVRALDVRGDLASCTAAQKSPDGRCDLALMGREAGRALTDIPQVYVWGVHFENGRLFASDMEHGLYVIDASALVR